MLTNLPERFDDYYVGAYINHGSYGHVFRVYRGDDLEFALKWLRVDAEAEGEKRFQNEKWALQQLDHPAIPKLVDEGELAGRPYFVMSLAQGVSLRTVSTEQIARGGAFGDKRLLGVTVMILDALHHMHSRSIFHRDVKDDNILFDDNTDHVSLIDLGFCRSIHQPVQDVRSFWGVGAARYSPPSKLNNPAHPHPTHDVFSVGVVAYQLLTNEFPWNVELTEDHGDLRRAMETTPPIPIHEINSLVSREISLFYQKLLSIDDDQRPTAADARDEAEEIQLRLLATSPRPSVLLGRKLSFPHVVRDPIHGDVRMTEFESRILNSREFQRLRWIKQLGFASLVYPSAEHTRLSHAIGTLYVTDRILKSIEDITGIQFDPEKRLMARSYALAHDVLHIAFGHTIEDELNIYSRHDTNNGRLDRLVRSDQSQLGGVLRSTSYGRELITYLDGMTTHDQGAGLRELIEGSTGADVLDYIDRDSYFCGLDHRVDSALYRRFRLVQAAGGKQDDQHLVAQLYGRHGFRLDAEFALESILVERFALFMKVYTHPTKIVAGAMLGKALAETILSGSHPEFAESDLESFGDVELLLELRRSKRKLCARIADQLLRRELFKTAFRARALKDGELSLRFYDARLMQFEQKGHFTPAGRADIEAELAKQSGLKTGDVVIYVSHSAPGLQKVNQYVREEPGREVMRDEVHGPHLQIVERHLKLWSVYVFVSPDVPENSIIRLGTAAEAQFGLKNELSLDRRERVLF
jgi:HD superfamily phosphohydrolase